MANRFHVGLDKMLDEQVILGGIKVQTALYADLRPQIKTGDCLVWAGNSVLQLAIRAWQKPKNSTLGLSHASLVIRPAKYNDWVDRVFMIEATGVQGLHPGILSQKLLQEHGRCFHISTNLSEIQRAMIEETAIIDACSNIPYDFGGCFYNVIARSVTDAARYFCSEYVASKWMDARYIPKGKAPTPNDLPLISPRPCAITEIIMKGGNA